MKRSWKNLLARVVFVVLSLATIVYGVRCNNKRIPFRIADVLQETNPVRVQYEHYDKYFGNDRTFYIMAELKDEAAIAPRPAWEMLKDLHWTFDRSKAIEDTASLYNSEYLHVDKDYTYLSPFLAKDGTMSDEAGEALDSEFFKKTLVSPDKKHLLITATFEKAMMGTGNERPYIGDVLKRLENVRQRHPDWVFYTLGVKIAEYHLIKDVIHTQRVITPLLVLALAVIVYWLFRSKGILVFFVHTLLMSYALTIIFIYAHAGGISMYAGFSIFFVMIIACSEMIHFFTVYQYVDATDVNQKIKETIKHVFVPCSLTCTSTVIGFGTLMISDVKPISDLGFYSAVSELIAFGLTFTLMPLGLKLFDFTYRTHRTMPAINVRGLLNLTMKHPAKIIAAFLAFGAFCYQMSSNLEINDQFYDQFHESHPVSVALRKFSEHFQFLDDVEIGMRFRADQKPSSPEVNKTMHDFEAELAALPEVSYIKSHAVFYDYMEGVLAKGEGRKPGVAPSERLDSLYERVQDVGVLDDFYNKDDHVFRAMAYVKDSNSKSITKLMADIQAVYDKRYKGQFQMELMGSSTMRAYLSQNLITDMVTSTGTEILLIFAVFLVIFRSLKLALLGLVPNLIPLVFIGGLLKVFHVPLQTNIVLLINITFGIAVDDTIHFLYPISVKLREGHESVAEILEHVFAEVGESLAATTVVIVFCFPCFYLADMKIYTQTGTLVMMALLFGMLAELCLTPALILKFCRQGEWSLWKWLTARRSRRGDGAAALNSHIAPEPDRQTS